MSIVVVGAGVTGLTTALLLSRLPNASVTVVAEHFPGDMAPTYTSPYAGADWHSFAAPGDTEQIEYDTAAWRQLWRLALLAEKTGRHDVIGVTVRQARVMTAGGVCEKPWFADLVKDYRELEAEELAPGTSAGFQFTTIQLIPAVYLKYLQDQCTEQGVKFVHAHLDHIVEAEAHLDRSSRHQVVVNCTGLQARVLGGVEDSGVFPVRGQIMVVRNRVRTISTVEWGNDPEHPNEMFYIMPRPDGTSIIGGCMQPHRFDTTVDPAMSERIKQRARRFVPEIVNPAYMGNPREIEVIREVAGLRPAREGGIRCEVDAGSVVSPGVHLVHNYGAGGAGYQSSWGTAEKVVRLVRAVQRGSSM